MGATGWSATIIFLAIGVILATYEVQGVKMPGWLFTLLIASMGITGFIALVVFVVSIYRRLRLLPKQFAFEWRIYRKDKMHSDQWLRDLAKYDLQRPGWSLRATNYEVDMTGLSETPSWVDFQVRVFNGGVHTIKVIEVVGQIRYTDDQGTSSPITPPPSLVYPPGTAQRGNEITLVLRQEVAPSMEAALLRDDPKGGKHVIRGFSFSGIGLLLKPEPSDNANVRSVLEHPFGDTVPYGHPFRVIGR